MKKIPSTVLLITLATVLVAACSKDKDAEKNQGAGGSTFAAVGGDTNEGGSSNEGGNDAVLGGNSGVALGGGSSRGGTSALGVGGVTATGTTACSNGLDDDKDGFIDGFDPECTGPIDNDETSFATGIPGDNRDPKWQDCFFDGNSGAGDDNCRYRTECLTGELPQSDSDCTLSAKCIEFCKPLTPNGCDCFGCCTVTLENGTTKDVLTGANCSLATINDSKVCTTCVKSASCGNTCGECELCIGKTEADLPASCTSTKTPPDSGVTPPSYTCDDGATVCSATAPCSASEYCSMGCCIVAIQ